MDVAAHLLYLDDFQERIKDIDSSVSAKTGNPPALVLAYEERPDEPNGYHVLNLASYYAQLEFARLDTSPHLNIVGNPTLRFSAYLVYAPMLARYVERTLERSSLSGNGDRAIYEFWTMLAVTLVRFRVLAHAEMFHGAKLRTKEDMIKHRLLFTTSKNEIEGLRSIESHYAKLMPLDQSNAHDVDTFWTLQLFAHALESGFTFEEALEYIICS